MQCADSRNCNVVNCTIVMLMICVRRADPFLDGTINKW